MTAASLILIQDWVRNLRLLEVQAALTWPRSAAAADCSWIKHSKHTCLPGGYIKSLNSFGWQGPWRSCSSNTPAMGREIISCNQSKLNPCMSKGVPYSYTGHCLGSLDKPRRKGDIRRADSYSLNQNSSYSTLCPQHRESLSEAKSMSSSASPWECTVLLERKCCLLASSTLGRQPQCQPELYIIDCMCLNTLFRNSSWFWVV